MRLKSLHLAMLTFSASSFAETPNTSFEGAVANGKAHVNFRYRYEFVNQDGKNDNANAHTLRSRLNYTTAPFYNFVAMAEFDNVAHLGDARFNDTTNGKINYPVVADPDGTDLNQSYIKYIGLEKSEIVFGRQRINQSNQRFMGGVGWRQNEQTYDSARINYQQIDWFNLDYSYTWQVNRIFGSASPKAKLNGDVHSLLLDFKSQSFGKFGILAYDMDFTNGTALSNQTLGASYNYAYKFNKTSNLGLNLTYAQQQDSGDNTTSYKANYYNAEFNTKISYFKLSAGIEVLGSDDGIQGFQTPLATLHKFQGFADMFLSTPAQGVQDIYASMGLIAKDIALIAFYHDFTADEGNKKWGQEIDLVAKYKFNKHYNLLLKYANYSADEHKTDTEKFWLQLVAAI